MPEQKKILLPPIIRNTPTSSPIPTQKPTASQTHILNTNNTPSPEPNTEKSSKYTYPFKLESELKKGSKGEAVNVLQSALATIKDVYPEATVSGYYGDLTSKAVKRFQDKFGLTISGNVDKDTLEKFNNIFDKTEASPTPEITEESKSNTTLIDQIIQFFKSLTK
jgi:peptidoglycan hydrolase-like protein with peptidoglycan-binding domain